MSRSDAGKMCLLVHALLILTVSSVLRTAYNNCERLPCVYNPHCVAFGRRVSRALDVRHNNRNSTVACQH